MRVINISVRQDYHWSVITQKSQDSAPIRCHDNRKWFGTVIGGTTQYRERNCEREGILSNM